MSLKMQFESAVRQIGFAVGQFLGWWQGQLLAAWEDWASRRSLNKGGRARVSFEKGEVVLSQLLTQGAKTLGSISKEGQLSEAPNLVRRVLDGNADSIGQLEICLPAQAVLRRRVHMPAAVGRRLRQAVGFQIERLMPLKAELVYYDCAIVGRDEVRKRILVEIAEARRELADAVAEAALGQGVRRVRVITRSLSETDKPLTLLVKRTSAGEDHSAPAHRRLAYSGICLLAAFIGLAVMQYHAQNVRLAAQVLTLKVNAEAAERLRDSLEDRIAKIHFIANRTEGPDTATVLAELTRRLPADTWVFQYQSEGGQLQIAGFAKDASALSALLSRSALFKQVALRSAVKAPGIDVERFDISIQLNTSTHS